MVIMKEKLSRIPTQPQVHDQPVPNSPGDFPSG
jgi:hypothetical protein